MLRGTAKRPSSEVKLFRLLARWRWLVWLAVWERGKSWLHVEVGGSQRHGSSQAIKTKQFGRFHQHDKLSRRGLASPNGSSGPTWIKFLERCLSVCQSRTRLVSVRRGWVVLLLSKHTGAKPLQLLCLPRPWAHRALLGTVGPPDPIATQQPQVLRVCCPAAPGE